MKIQELKNLLNKRNILRANFEEKSCLLEETKSNNQNIFKNFYLKKLNSLISAYLNINTIRKKLALTLSNKIDFFSDIEN